MGDSYDRVREHQQTVGRWQPARWRRPDHKDSKKVREYLVYPKYLHVLVGADHEAGADGEEWSGRLQAITKQMDKNTAGTEDNMQKLAEELKQMS